MVDISSYQVGMDDFVLLSSNAGANNDNVMISLNK
jgi:hypothetical protein